MSSTTPFPQEPSVVELVSAVESVVSPVIDESVVVVSSVAVSMVVDEVVLVEVVGSTGVVVPVLDSPTVVVEPVLVEAGVVPVVSDATLVTSTSPLSSPLAQPNGLYFPQLLLIPQPSTAKWARSRGRRASMADGLIFAQVKRGCKACFGLVQGERRAYHHRPEGPMKLVCVWTALMLLQPTLAAGSQAAAATPQVIGSKEERSAAAAAYYTQGDFVRAALGFEGLRIDFPQAPDFLFNAAASRHGAGHDAHAVAYTREYLALSSLSAADRQEAEAQLREAESNVGSLDVTVAAEPGGQGPLMLIARHVPRESSDIRPDLSFSASTGAPTRLALDPGVWTIRAQGAGYVAAEQRVELLKGQAPAIAFQLARTPVERTGPVLPQSGVDVPPEVVKRTALGLEIGGGLAAVAGLAILGSGASGVGKAAKCTNETNQGACVDHLRDGLLRRDIGVATFGAGVGLLVGGLTWKIGDAAGRRKAWIAEAAIGGVALVAGMIAVPLSLTSFNEDNDANKLAANDATGGGTYPTWDEHYEKHRRSAGHAVSSAVFGLGLGTLVSASTSLVLQRRHLSNRVQVGGMAGRGQFGVTLSGRF